MSYRHNFLVMNLFNKFHNIGTLISDSLFLSEINASDKKG